MKKLSIYKYFVKDMFNSLEVSIENKLQYDAKTFIDALKYVKPEIKSQTVDRYLRMAKEDLKRNIRYNTVKILEAYQQTDDCLRYVVENYFRGTHWLKAEFNYNNTPDNLDFYEKEVANSLDVMNSQAFEASLRLVDKK